MILYIFFFLKVMKDVYFLFSFPCHCSEKYKLSMIFFSLFIFFKDFLLLKGR